MIRAKMEADGVVEKPDVIGAVFGQTEGLMGDELDLRDLQKSGRIGRIEVEVNSKKGKTEGMIHIPSSLDQVDTSILAAGLETIDRVGPCKATITVQTVEDVRVTKRSKVVDRAKEILSTMLEGSKTVGLDVKEEVRQAVQVAEIVSYGSDKLPAGPNVAESDAVIVVEGRSDVLNLLRCGIKNAVAAEGTAIPPTIQNLSKEKVVTAFVDGDRGGDLILKELLQVAEVDFVAKAPKGREVEELTQKQITKALRNKMPMEQFVESVGLSVEKEKRPEKKEKGRKRREPEKEDKGKDEPKEKPKEKPKAQKPETAPELQDYADILSSLRGSTKAQLLKSGKGKPMEVPVRDLANVLQKEGKGLAAVVFDGIITQRILDIARDNGVEYVIGVKTGNVVKQPSEVKVYTADDLPSK